MKILKRTFIMILLTLICIFIIDHFQRERQLHRMEQSEMHNKTNPSEQTSADGQTNPEQPANYVSFLALGQCLLNDSALASGVGEDGSRNYDFLFEGVSDYIQNADITVLCQGSVIGGNDLGVSGYPSFNAPEEFAMSAVKAGVDVAAMANIRINRLGSTAITNSIRIWKQQSEEFQVLGIYENEEDTAVSIIEKNGLKIALLDYTAIIEEPLSDQDASKVSFLGNYAGGRADLSALSEKTVAEIDYAQKSADFVVVFVSWGLDDTYNITSAQERFSLLLTEAGADLIIGNRPNQIQKVEWITSENGNRALCYYSLGNFVSSEHTADALVGGMAKVGIKVENGLTVIDEENTGVVPVVIGYTDNGNAEQVQVTGALPFADYTDEMAQNHGLFTKYGISLTRDVVQNILNANIRQEFLNVGAEPQTK